MDKKLSPYKEKYIKWTGIIDKHMKRLKHIGVFVTKTEYEEINTILSRSKYNNYGDHRHESYWVELDYKNQTWKMSQLNHSINPEESWLNNCINEFHSKIDMRPSDHYPLIDYLSHFFDGINYDDETFDG